MECAEINFNDVFFVAVQENVALPSSTYHTELDLLEMYLICSGFTRISYLEGKAHSGIHVSNFTFF